MMFLIQLYVLMRGLQKKQNKGQTMTEYALILASIAIVVFLTYQVMGQDVGRLVSNIDKALTTT